MLCIPIALIKKVEMKTGNIYVCVNTDNELITAILIMNTPH